MHLSTKFIGIFLSVCALLITILMVVGFSFKTRGLLSLLFSLTCESFLFTAISSLTKGFSFSRKYSKMNYYVIWSENIHSAGTGAKRIERNGDPPGRHCRRGISKL